jgi:hypothetical protein
MLEKLASERNENDLRKFCIGKSFKTRENWLSEWKIVEFPRELSDSYWEGEKV